MVKLRDLESILCPWWELHPKPGWPERASYIWHGLFVFLRVFSFLELDLSSLVFSCLLG